MKKIIFIGLCLSFNLFAHTKHYFSSTPLKVITIGHPTLTMVAQEVDHQEILTPKLQNFIDELIKTMKKAGGVGIAAPQVNISKRLFIIKPGLFKKAETIINPTIEYNEMLGKKSSTEGCLSIPGKKFKVNRYKEVNINYYNRKGVFKAETASGFRAIVFQHEYDHLNGIMISDFFNLEIFGIEEFEHVPVM
ncbi:MAG: peptide deformylase [Halobacteriovoraceae bacterium]|jgi:peptide deformylase|nr:peptide deformylase [Halobacteriovoraceae bacterium]